MKYLLVIAAYTDGRQDHFNRYHSPRNYSYARQHGFKYIEIRNLFDIPVQCRQRAIVWYRFFLIREWIRSGFLKTGDILSQIDADVCIINGSKPLEPSDGKNFAYAIDSCNTHCMGIFSLRVCEWTERMLDNLLDEKRWNKYKDTPFWKVFHEQACWYSLAGIKATFADPSQPSWIKIPHLGWCSTQENEPVYRLKELYKNVEILPVEWNVTDWKHKSPYYRFPTKTNRLEDVIFLHFAGSRNWRPFRLFASRPLILR